MPRATSSSLYSRKKLGRILRNGDFFFPLYPAVRALKMPSQTGIYWQHCQGCNSYPCCVSVPASQMCTWEFFRGTTMCIPYPKPAMVLFSLSSTDSKWGEQSQAISPLCYREDSFFPYIWLKFSLHSLISWLSNRATFLHSVTASPSGEVGTAIGSVSVSRLFADL